MELLNTSCTLTGGMNGLRTKAELNKQNRQFVSGHVGGSRRKDKKKTNQGALQSQRGHMKCSVQHEAMRCHYMVIPGQL